MPLAKNGTVNKKRHKKILKMAKGYQGRNRTCFRVAVEKVEKGLQYAYRDRRNKKRDFRKLWIQRINAAARLNGLTYSKLISGLKLAGIELDRKVLSDIAITDEAGFKAIAEKAAKALEKNSKAA
ncbi:MAG: 50S ribosomal protein L20 [Rickettsiales bacterium]|nr:50S ribosomal protein L20 [Pseudomonadota bacterium]MDG4543328.1 50S ribosomal protein L20 [Rickettsiales bacterium]PIR38699.1 MAG: 50S ribosomal protein L20 [Alphaproteobacteria bacterium CG11_big_fil_rev_8_21_14_0_20_39_49]MDA0966466.1 50S ribosomal protein L20 [Pseudomonadota bacterium]MDG4545594.1 50S ribosomal protein L20 [Rickettsiales bacterium]